MAEDDSSGDKTEAATPRRRQEAFDAGQFPKSADLTSAILLLTGIVAVAFTGKAVVNALAQIMHDLLGPQGVWSDPVGLTDNVYRVSAPGMARALAPIMIAVSAAAIIATGFQVGFRVNFQPLMPNLAKLNPFQGFGRLFSAPNFVQLAMNLIKLVIISAVAWQRVNAHLETIMGLSGLAFPANFEAGCSIIYDLAWRLVMILLVLAAVDWVYHKWQFERDIRMSKQDVKDEAKRMEGDMAAKGRRRQLARKMIMQRIHRDVPKADVVVTNPTELAIALRYDPDSMGAPKVVAKGAGFLAARIRQIAIANGVPILERKPLAQTLYKTVDVGHEVPPELYQAIAEILAYVYELAGKGARQLRKAS
ncbi:MAG TPA: EscU/YscU/HrcU family type III secretion system export apparatus switch protein [Phycisphaerae bacterium]|jgi:flagellar biosynthetic protein FlhB|nr:EscU/YscU/HrcU family type III secretion system export apparatus switch protein [Phycisphaerae bacterium]